MRVGDTAAVCGVRGEILYVRNIADYSPRNHSSGRLGNNAEDEGGRTAAAVAEGRRRKEDADEMARLNLVVPNLELATGCSPAHLPGGPPSALAQTLSQRILTLLHTTHILSMDDLRIWSSPGPSPFPTSPATEKMDTSSEDDAGNEKAPAEPPLKPEIKAFWTLYIDVVFISLDGNPFDAAWSSVLGALLDTRLPQTSFEPDLDSVICSDLRSLATPLNLRSFPIPLSFGLFQSPSAEDKDVVLVDMDAFEEPLCSEKGTVVVAGEDGQGLVGVEKFGGGGIGGVQLRGLVGVAAQRWKEWRDVLGWQG